MGVLADRELREFHLRPPKPRPVGSVSAVIERAEASATLMEMVSGEWEYAEEEIPVWLSLHNWMEIPLGGERRVYSVGITLAVVADALPKTRPKQRYFAVAALEPARWGWSVCAPLRRVFKRTKAERAAAIERSLQEGKALRDLDWDPFHQTAGELAARLNDPLRLHYDQGVNLGGGFLKGTQPRGVDRAIWRFGICPEACLADFAIPREESKRFPAPGMVRVPPTEAGSLREAAVRYALAGRAEGSPIRFRQVLKKAWDALAPTEKEAGRGCI